MSQRGLVGRVGCRYEPSPPNIEGPGGVKYPHIGKKGPFLDKNRPFDSKISYGG